MNPSAQRGLTLLELMLALCLSTLVLLAAQSLWSRFAMSQLRLEEQHALTEQAHFAMRRMVKAIAHTEALIVPTADITSTAWREHVREQTIPASTPENGSTLATAVLVVALDPDTDADRDGISDADNDGDGRINEDPGNNRSGQAQGRSTVRLDRNGDGVVGMGNGDDDEDGAVDEDPANGIDDDGDGLIDEDTGADLNSDGEAGIAGVDDDGDGSIDEGNLMSDDEDSRHDEDWIDEVGFYLDGDQLMEMRPTAPSEVPNHHNAWSEVLTVADNVTALRFERIENSSGSELVDIQLTLSQGSSTITLDTTVRVGGQR